MTNSILLRLRPASPVSSAMLAAVGATALAVACATAEPVVVTSPGAGQSDRNVRETRTFTEPFGAGARFDLENFNGRVSVTPWDREEAEIVATLSGRSQAALERTSVEIERAGEGVTVRTVHDRSRGRNSAGVRYEVRLPRRADIRLRNTNGQIEVGGFVGELDVETTNGAIQLGEHDGQVSVRTTNGAIEGSLARFGADDRHELKTTNGAIKVTLAPDAGGRLDARTSNGTVRLDLGPVEDLDQPTRRRRSVRFGDGGGFLDARTTNGAITVARDDR